MLTESFSGIRGLFNQDLTREVIDNYALSFANFLKKKNQKPLILIGMDTRPSSPIIKADMKKIFREQGIDVYDVGFNSKSVFNTAFKKHAGMTPTQFKRKYLN